MFSMELYVFTSQNHHIFPFSSFSIQISIKTSSAVHKHFHHLLWGVGKIVYVVFPLTLSSVVERKWKIVVFVWMGKMATNWIDTKNEFNDWLLGNFLTPADCKGRLGSFLSNSIHRMIFAYEFLNVVILIHIYEL